MQLDPTQLAAVVVKALGPVFKAVEQRVERLEQQEAPRGEKGDPGVDGHEGPEGRRGDDGAAGRDGLDGKDAPPPTDDQVLAALASRPDLVAKACEATIAALVTQQVEAYMSAHPVRDGRDGLPGVPGLPGEKGISGLDGKDGADGLGFDDFEVTDDADGHQWLKYARGEKVKHYRWQNQVDRGIWDPDKPYLKGDGVSLNGCYWIAQRDDIGSRPTISDAWRLAVKKGEDGRTGKPGLKGQDGRNGKDWHEVKPDGSPWDRK